MYAWYADAIDDVNVDDADTDADIDADADTADNHLWSLSMQGSTGRGAGDHWAAKVSLKKKT